MFGRGKHFQIAGYLLHYTLQIMMYIIKKAHKQTFSCIYQKLLIGNFPKF